MKGSLWKVWKPRLRKALFVAATIILPMVMGNSNLFNAIWDTIFPPAGYYGGMALPIVSVSSGRRSGTFEAILLLLQHAKSSQETFELLSSVPPSTVAAGSASQPPLRTLGITENAAGSSCFLRVDLPPSTLYAISASTEEKVHLAASDFMYSRHDGIRKGFRGDLIIKTRNEELGRNLFWLGFALAVGCIGHALGRWRPHSLPVARQDQTRRSSKR